MQVKHFIKLLEKYDPNLVVGLNVLTPDGSELWVIDKKAIKVMDQGKSLVLANLRLNHITNERLMKQVKMPSVASVRCDVDSLIERIKQRYNLELEDPNSQEELGEISDEEALTFFTSIIKQDIEDLLILLEDFKRLTRRG